jgi:hypothetical protein
VRFVRNAGALMGSLWERDVLLAEKCFLTPADISEILNISSSHHARRRADSAALIPPLEPGTATQRFLIPTPLHNCTASVRYRMAGCNL